MFRDLSAFRVTVKVRVRLRFGVQGFILKGLSLSFPVLRVYVSGCTAEFIAVGDL